MLLGGILPEVREAFNEPAAKAWGAAMVPVAAKYGWTVSAIGPELALAMASAPGVLAVGVAISRRKSAAKDGARTSSPGDASKVRADPNASPMVRPA